MGKCIAADTPMVDTATGAVVTRGSSPPEPRPVGDCVCGRSTAVVDSAMPTSVP